MLLRINLFINIYLDGNPAAVVLLKSDIEDSFKQKIASEIKLSETAFVLCKNVNDFVSENEFYIRWFTPSNEVPLCGHATLASAAVLFYRKKNKNKLSFETMGGDELHVELENDGYISMNFPHNPTDNLDKSLVDPAIEIAKAILPDLNKVLEFKFSPGTKKLLLRLDETKITSDDILRIEPNCEEMLKVKSNDCIRGVIVTHKDLIKERYDFVSRYFSPWNGIPEDPVNGSGHTALAPYWSDILAKKTLFAGVLSKRTGQLRLNYNEAKGRVSISGKACVVIEGLINT
ncbi:phenazine biosynthesis-like domain-containing protein isoform X2 [Lepeophtheirus salmonis]|uniref:phenazine biosynthesis-like domain-containing protein isoform X2 n=1 Tax=Lepeophtheirus salmonis TaxID=72036 RepID=UPI001AE1F2F0|nr:phenazine biosynthesis-like domain-containing protein isoform X2 [Lepeophtheirus salmonis]